MTLPALAPTTGRLRDRALSARAAAVIPGGMYGHLDRSNFPPDYPQFFSRGRGVRMWDVDDNEYVDLMCAWGPMIVGYANPRVDAAHARQVADGDVLNGPGAPMVELAELLVDTVAHADWAMFAKNGNDATTLALTVARAATGRRKVLKFTGAYHGATPWCSPSMVGITPEDRANVVEFAFDDLAAATRAAEEHDGDVAAIIATPYQHETFVDQRLASAEFVRGLRALADRIGAVLVLDDVRCGFRYDLAGSWEQYGVRPDLSAYSKAIANGYPLAALTGVDALREASSRVFATGSFWFAAAPMAAAIETITQLRDGDGLARMRDAGERLRTGLLEQAAAHGLGVHHTGPVQMPLLRFDDDPDIAKVSRWCTEAINLGVYAHPWHNWFLSAAHGPGDIDQVLSVTDHAFAVVAGEAPPTRATTTS